MLITLPSHRIDDTSAVTSLTFGWVVTWVTPLTVTPSKKNSTLKIKGKEKYIRVQIYLQRLDGMTDSFIFRNLSKYMQQIVCYRRFCRLLWDCTLVFLNQAYDFQCTYTAQCLSCYQSNPWSLLRNHNSNNNLPTIYSVRQSTWHFIVSLTFI